MKTLASEWAKFKRLIVPKDAPEVQIVETRRAFYAGANSMTLCIMAASSDPGDDPTEADISRMSALYAEIEAFSAEVKAGRA